MGKPTQETRIQAPYDMLSHEGGRRLFSRLLPWAFLLAVVLFWGLRISYWNSTEEMPFSDMVGLENMARNIRHHFDFSWDPFFQSFGTPTTPALRAVQCLLLGESLTAWRYLQTALLFAGALWLAYEIFVISRSGWLAFGLFLLVSLSKPSIFWSLKLARESLAESFIYFTVAGCLRSFRTERRASFVMTGVLFGLALLNRPNFLLAIPALAVVIVANGIPRAGTKERLSILKRNAAFLGCFALGLALTWGPWIVRSYRLYHHPVPLTTQVPYTFFWEWGVVTVQDDDGAAIDFTKNTLQAEAPGKFENDYQAYVYGKGLIRQWLKTNWRDYLARIPSNITRSAQNYTVMLTKVSRRHLFSDWRDKLLIDKSSLLVLTGIIGLIAWLWGRPPWLVSVAVVALTPWLNSAFFLSLPRMFDPHITIILFGNLLLAQTVWNLASRRFWLNTPTDEKADPRFIPYPEQS